MHLILILLIVLIIFGPGKLPELGEGLGKSIKAFKKAMKEGQDAPAIEKKEEKKA
jgi:sec-independent protein translocase protein TatA